jgi:hypothetical protein
MLVEALQLSRQSFGCWPYVRLGQKRTWERTSLIVRFVPIADIGKLARVRSGPRDLAGARSRSMAASGGSPSMGVRRRQGQGMYPRIGHAVCLGQQPGVLHTLLVAVEAATGTAGPRAPGMLDVGFTRRGPATKTSDERCDGRGRAAQQFRQTAGDRHSAP